MFSNPSLITRMTIARALVLSSDLLVLFSYLSFCRMPVGSFDGVSCFGTRLLGPLLASSEYSPGTPFSTCRCHGGSDPPSLTRG